MCSVCLYIEWCVCVCVCVCRSEEKGRGIKQHHRLMQPPATPLISVWGPSELLSGCFYPIPSQTGWTCGCLQRRDESILGVQEHLLRVSLLSRSGAWLPVSSRQRYEEPSGQSSLDIVDIFRGECCLPLNCSWSGGIGRLLTGRLVSQRFILSCVFCGWVHRSAGTQPPYVPLLIVFTRFSFKLSSPQHFLARSLHKLHTPRRTIVGLRDARDTACQLRDASDPPGHESSKIWTRTRLDAALISTEHENKTMCKMNERFFWWGDSSSGGEEGCTSPLCIVWWEHTEGSYLRFRHPLSLCSDPLSSSVGHWACRTHSHRIGRWIKPLILPQFI